MAVYYPSDKEFFKEVEISSKDNVGKRRPIDYRLRRAIIADTFAGLGVNLIGVFEVVEIG
jgi:hypothetical protein